MKLSENNAQLEIPFKMGYVVLVFLGHLSCQVSHEKLDLKLIESHRSLVTSK